jgi:uncharacterized protein YjiK
MKTRLLQTLGMILMGLSAVASSRGGAGTVSEILKANSAGVVSADNGITAPRNRNLSAMRLTRTVKPFDTLKGISGVTYNPRTGTLFHVRNVGGGAGNTYETTLDGTLLRTIKHSNFVDTEAIAYVTSFRNTGGVIYDVFLFAEEDHTSASLEGSLTLCLLSSAAITLDKAATNGSDPDNRSVTTAYSNGTMGNIGIEAVAYDFKRSACYYTAEFQTTARSDNTPGTGNAKIFTRSIIANSTRLSFGSESVLSNINALYSNVLSGGDISDMCYSAQDDTILLLSDDLGKVIKITRAGSVVETLATPGEQPEGVTLNPDGSAMWVVGEDSDGFSAGEFFRYQLGFAAAPEGSNSQ